MPNTSKPGPTSGAIPGSLEGLGNIAMSEGTSSLALALLTPSLTPALDEKARCLAMGKNGCLRQRSDY